MNRLTACTAGLCLTLAACSETAFEPRLTKLPRELSAAEAQLVAADNTFAFALLRATLAEDSTSPNVFISPLSVSVALGMTLNGAAGATADEMRAGLGFGGMSQADINAGYRGLIDLLGGLDSRVTWRLANSVWYRQDYTFNPAFFDTTQKYFDALVSPLDFTSPDAGPTINRWVSDQTSGRIPNIVPDVLPDDAIVYLVNAIYFKGDWTTRFDPARTHAASFYAPTGTVSVPTMTADDVPFRLGGAPGLLVAELPYARGAYAMTIVMPTSGAALDSLAAHVTAQDWAGWVASLDSARMMVSLPKFTVQYGRKLNDELDALGMHRMLCGNGSDFTPLDPSGRACVFEVQHKTFVQVDEAGTEAAAVTEVGMRPTSAPPTTVINRPFLFAIRERLSGTIIFLGVIRNPAAS